MQATVRSVVDQEKQLQQYFTAITPLQKKCEHYNDVENTMELMWFFLLLFNDKCRLIHMLNLSHDSFLITVD